MGKDKKNKREIEFEGAMGREVVAGYLEKVIEGLRSGTVAVHRGGEALALHPEEVVRVEVEARQKEQKESLAIKLRWRASEPLQAQDLVSLEISSTEPEPPPPAEEAAASGQAGEVPKPGEVEL